MSIRLADAGSTKLRFAVGARVECNCGQWKPGTVIKHFYVQKTFKEGMCAPYQVRLDDNKLIFAPADQDNVIRAIFDDLYQDGDFDDFEIDEDVKDKDKLPVTVITGFLGSGKTTLVNHILTEKHGVRVCVIENEFGSVDIDTSLVKEKMQAAEEIISLDNGCACCTVRGDLVRALGQLKDKKAEFDLVLLETTGMANPAPVVATFTQNASIANHFRVDGIVCLVDSKHISARLSEDKGPDAINEAVCQVAFSDRIMLNKVDLVSTDELLEVKRTISSINSYAAMFETERSKIDLNHIMNISAFSIERLNAGLEEFEIELGDGFEEEAESAEHGHGDAAPMEASHDDSPHDDYPHDDNPHLDASDHGHGQPASSAAEHGHAANAEEKPKRKRKHDLSGVGSLGLTASAPLISHEFNAFMSNILRVRSKDLYRSKGVLAFKEEGDAKFIFQGVHEQIQYTTAAEPWGPDEPKISKVVFIGRGLDHEELRAGWQRCISGQNTTERKGFLSSLVSS